MLFSLQHGFLAGEMNVYSLCFSLIHHKYTDQPASASLKLLLCLAAALCGQELLLLLQEADHLWTPEQ